MSKELEELAKALSTPPLEKDERGNDPKVEPVSSIFVEGRVFPFPPEEETKAEKESPKIKMRTFWIMEGDDE